MPKQFQHIAAVDILNITEKGKQKLQDYSEKPIKFPDTHPQDLEEIAHRIGDSDAILISWETVLSDAIISLAPNLKYIGICATSQANLPQYAIDKKKITVTNVTDYSEQGTAEYIFLQLLKVTRGDGPHLWKQQATELNGKTMGLIGMGPIGQQVTKLALGLEMKVLYHCPSRKPSVENEQMQYSNLPDLLHYSDIISIHVPKDTKILDPELFAKIKEGAILVNTSMGKVFKEEDFIKWIQKGKNIAIFDKSVSEDYYKAFSDLDKVILCPDIAGITLEAKDRLTAKVIENIEKYLESTKAIK